MGWTAFSFVPILVLVINLALRSSALPVNNVEDLDNPLIFFNELKRLSNDETEEWNDEISARHFIGDLVVGSRRNDEVTLRNKIELINSTPDVSSQTLYYYSSGIFHYLSIQNDEGSYMVACDTPYTLGSKLAEVNVRLPANSKATFTVFGAIHYGD